jgi:ribonuclease Z
MRIKVTVLTIMFLLILPSFLFLTKQSPEGLSEGNFPIAGPPEARAAEADSSEWSPTKPYPIHNVYYPGTEELKPDEMRVIALGSGMPMPRRKQAAASFLIELGNGDKFIFDMGTGSMERLYALGIPLDFINKVFLTHLHADHMGDLPGFYIYGPQNNRSVPLKVWGPRRWYSS